MSSWPRGFISFIHLVILSSFHPNVGSWPVSSWPCCFISSIPLVILSFFHPNLGLDLCPNGLLSSCNILLWSFCPHLIPKWGLDLCPTGLLSSCLLFLWFFCPHLFYTSGSFVLISSQSGVLTCVLLASCPHVFYSSDLLSLNHPHLGSCPVSSWPRGLLLLLWSFCAHLIPIWSLDLCPTGLLSLCNILLWSFCPQLIPICLALCSTGILSSCLLFLWSFCSHLIPIWVWHVSSWFPLRIPLVLLSSSHPNWGLDLCPTGRLSCFGLFVVNSSQSEVLFCVLWSSALLNLKLLLLTLVHCLLKLWSCYPLFF